MIEKRINVAELLKDCPKGMKLDCTMYNSVSLLSVDDREDIIFPIKALREDGNYIALTKYGQYTDEDFAKCVIFPKGRTTWEGFHRPFKDGEVVAYDGQYTGHVKIFIFKDKKEYNTLSTCYLMLDGDELDLEEGVHYVTRIATEEEKAKLFDVIKANGYKWNAESKTLEKLIVPKFKVGDKVKQKGSPRHYIINSIEFDRYILSNNQFIRFRDEHIYELVPNKFDINTLKPFDKVLVRDNNTQKWTVDFFSFFDKSLIYPYSCVGHYINQCIPYEGNEHLLGTTNDCDDFYKTW